MNARGIIPAGVLLKSTNNYGLAGLLVSPELPPFKLFELEPELEPPGLDAPPSYRLDVDPAS
jgi:hypothetical protein